MPPGNNTTGGPLFRVFSINRIRRLSPDRWRLESRNPKQAASSQQPEHAFTLLEVMVALAIMSIVLVSVYRMHSQSISMNAMARFYTQAPLLAQYKMAELEADSANDLSSDSGDFGDDFPGYTWQVAVNEVSSEALGDISNDLVGIDVTVFYNENEHSYSIRTYRFLRQ